MSAARPPYREHDTPEQVDEDARLRAENFVEFFSDHLSINSTRYLIKALEAELHKRIAERNGFSQAVGSFAWDDCKVAFNVSYVDRVWAAYDRGELNLPAGWTLSSTDSTGARCVVIFRVEGTPITEDGERVREILNKIAE